jgi:cell shape-determining protein MreC
LKEGQVIGSAGAKATKTFAGVQDRFRTVFAHLAELMQLNHKTYELKKEALP